jgi:hypothetical protein
MPVELEDFPEQLLLVYDVYSKLPDIFEPMGGNYQGKNTITLPILMDCYEIAGSDRLWFIETFNMFEEARSSAIRTKKAAEDMKNKVKPPSL